MTGNFYHYFLKCSSPTPPVAATDWTINVDCFSFGFMCLSTGRLLPSRHKPGLILFRQNIFLLVLMKDHICFSTNITDEVNSASQKIAIPEVRTDLDQEHKQSWPGHRAWAASGPPQDSSLLLFVHCHLRSSDTCEGITQHLADLPPVAPGSTQLLTKHPLQNCPWQLCQKEKRGPINLTIQLLL